MISQISYLQVQLNLTSQSDHRRFSMIKFSKRNQKIKELDGKAILSLLRKTICTDVFLVPINRLLILWDA